MMNKLIAFKGSKKVKNKYIKRLEKHYKMDEIIQGVGWENGKGCMIGCIFNKYNHLLFGSELDLPEELAHLVDKIFEGLTNKEAKEFPLEFIRAVNIGADLSKFCTKFKIYLLTDKEDGVINNIKKGKPYSDECTKAIECVADLLTRSLQEEITKEEWSEARNAAFSAESNTKVEASSYDYVHEYSTFAATDAAAWSTRSNPRSTARSVESAARSFYWQFFGSKESKSKELIFFDVYTKMKNKLIELVKEEK